mgnify:CR=1 FL=1
MKLSAEKLVRLLLKVNNMMHTKNKKTARRAQRHNKIRARVSGTAERPRLNVYRSLTGVKAQLIDDVSGKTLCSVESKTVDAKGVDVGERKGKTAAAYAVGYKLAEKAKAQNITTVVFDRGGFAYHGRVQALADGARDGGLQF